MPCSVLIQAALCYNFSPVLKYFISFALLVFLVFPVLAKEKYLRDVPEGHWAYDAVYDLVRRGVTGGFPDGTYRGKKPITRFEIAAFLTKLERSFRLQQGRDEKLIEELRAEASLYEYERAKERKETQIGGVLDSRYRAGAQGGRADYRLRASLLKNFGDNAGLKIKLDTMDGGFGGAATDLVREMIDIEGKLTFGPSAIKVTSGPGDVTHIDNGFFPSENKMVFIRPRRALSYCLNLENTAFSIEYLARSSQPSGFLDVSEVSARVVQNFRGLRVTFNPRVFYNVSGDRDVRLDLGGEYKPTKLLNTGLVLGIAKNTEFPHGGYVRGEIALADNFKLILQKTGSQYREQFSYGIYDIFDRDLPDGSASAGCELYKAFNKNWSVKAIGEYTSPGPVSTLELRLGYNINPDCGFELMFQNYKAAEISQILGIAAKYEF
jgi:hypothetical protein